MPPRVVPVAPQYRWNQLAGRAHEGRYINSAGRLVSRISVRNAIDKTIESSHSSVRALAESLKSGKIGLVDWRNGMMAEIKSNHLANAAAARGGWDQMTAADFGRVGQRIKREYAFLNNFVVDIATGRQALDGRFFLRAGMYVDAGRGTYEALVREEMTIRGMVMMRNVLHPADHCEGCLEQDGLGWIPIESSEWIPIGYRTCKTQDKCTAEFMDAAGNTTS